MLEELLRSLRNPHPESQELPELGLGQWSARLPEEDDLVDADAGTAVRWIPDEGWREVDGITR